MSEEVLREYRISDMDGILSLINLVQPHVPFTPERWRWEYPECVGEPARVWLIELAGQVIGHAGYLTFDWFIDGEKSKAHLWVDAMIHPNHRLKGLYLNLMDAMLGQFHRSSAQFACVYPNEKSVRGIVGLNWAQVARIPLLVHKPSAPAQGTRLTDVEVRQIGEFDDRITRLTESLKDTFRFACARDAAYLTWRFLRKPDDSYQPYIALKAGQLAGYMVYKFYQRTGEPSRAHIVDLWTAPDDVEAMVALVRHALAMSAGAGVSELSCWMLPHAPCHEILLEHGFAPEGVSRYLFACPSKRLADSQIFAEASNWYITMGDSDVY